MGVVTPSGDTKIKLQYDLVLNFSEGLCAVKVDRKWGYIDRTEKLRIHHLYSEVGSFRNDRAFFKVKEFKKKGYIDREGNEIIVNPRYLISSVYSEGVASAIFDGKFGFIDLDGNMTISPSFESVGFFSEGLASVKMNGLYGYIDINGNVKIHPKYEYASEFKDGIAYVTQGEKIGFISKTGEFIIKPQYDDIDSLSFGRELVNVRLEIKYINILNNEHVFSYQR